jgi:hypothetical protein
MHLDIQSLINLYPFFSPTQLLTWLEEAGEVFSDQLRQEKVGDLLGRLDPHTTLGEVESWYVREYVARGGRAAWSGSITKALFNQYLKSLGNPREGKVRLPMPGGRYYLMTDAVGDFQLPEGTIHLDQAAHTAWVNREDWHTYLAAVLGGADQDDAVWLFPFMDTDAEKKVLVWRSPNQAGEYVILRPTDDSHAFVWTTVDGETTYPQGDSQLLPPRLDTLKVNYLGSIPPITLHEENATYTIESMNATLRQAETNTGALGLYCNVLMVTQAIYGRLPKQPPAPLEQVIDGAVKTGADLSSIKLWCREASRRIVAQKKPVPRLLHERLFLSKNDPRPRPDPQHWLTTLMEGMEAHQQTMTKVRDTFITQTMPPPAVLAYVFTQPEMLDHGKKFNQLYHGFLQQTYRRYRRIQPEDYEVAYQRSVAYLNRQQDDRAVLLGAYVRSYLHPPLGHDSAVWQTPLPRNTATRRIAQRTMQALVDLGVLDELDETAEAGLIRYPGAVIQEIPARLIHIQGVWFQWLRHQLAQRGLPVPETMGDVPRPQLVFAKKQIAHLAQQYFPQMAIRLEEKAGRVWVYTAHGNMLGVLHQDTAWVLSSSALLRLEVCIAHDGNLIALLKD